MSTKTLRQEWTFLHTILVTMAALISVLLLFQGRVSGADIEAWVTPGEPFNIGWAAANPPGDGYEVERSMNGAAWALLGQTTEQAQFTEMLTGGAAQYKVKAYNLISYTDLDGTHESRQYGPYSEISLTFIAGEEPEEPGPCGRPGLLQ